MYSAEVLSLLQGDIAADRLGVLEGRGTHAFVLAQCVSAGRCATEIKLETGCPVCAPFSPRSRPVGPPFTPCKKYIFTT